MKKVKLTELTCLHCQHQWYARSEIVKKCPRCQSFAWDRPKYEKIKYEEIGKS